MVERIIIESPKNSKRCLHFYARKINWFSVGTFSSFVAFDSACTKCKWIMPFGCACYATVARQLHTKPMDLHTFFSLPQHKNHSFSKRIFSWLECHLGVVDHRWVVSHIKWGVSIDGWHNCVCDPRCCISSKHPQEFHPIEPNCAVHTLLYCQIRARLAVNRIAKCRRLSALGLARLGSRKSEIEIYCVKPTTIEVHAIGCWLLPMTANISLMPNAVIDWFMRHFN